MFRNYLLVTIRVFRKHKLYSFLNVFGLALGLTVALLIGLYVRFESSYDRYNERADRTYKIIQKQHDNVFMGSNVFAVTPAPLEEALRDELSYVEESTQLNKMRAIVNSGSSGFYEEGLFATPSFLRVFDFQLLQGDPESVLEQPNSILLTPEFATKVFGTTDAIGKTLTLTYWDDVLTPVVTGIVSAPPANSHFDFSYVLTYAGYAGRTIGQWGNNSYHTYAVLRSADDASRFDADMQAIVDRNMADLSWIKEGNAKIPAFAAQPLLDIHLRSHANFELAKNGDIRYVWLLIFAAGIILLTACINYMNLATARAATRHREVGVRKVAGAAKSQLVRQFMGESIFVALAASSIAVAMTLFLLPAFNSIVERDIPKSLLLSGWFVALVPALGLFVGLVSGSYPALVLSKVAPSRILKSGGTAGRSKSLLRNSLVVTQFVIAVVLVIGTFVVRQQLSYIKQTDTGIVRDHVLAVTIRDMKASDRWESLQAELAGVAGVTAVTAASDLPTNISSSRSIDDWDGHQGDQEATLYTASVTYGFADLVGLEFLEGRDFSRDFATDEGHGLIINKTAMRQLGWDTAVGKRINMEANGEEVIAVVEDFQFHSAHLEIMPMALTLDTKRINQVLVKIQPGDIRGTVERIETVVAGFLSEYPFEYQFLDDAYNAMYSAEQRLGIIFSIVTGLALVIACLGLFGLAAFMALQRTKEIGVRKALGAGLNDIALLLSRDFGRLVLIAFVIGSPIAYVAMQQWLKRFAFHIEIGPTIFLAAGLLTVFVALVTVGYHSVKASLMDPVKALRYE